MNIKKIAKAQKEMGVNELQEWINSGIAWKMEGSVGRAAMAALESGECMLPKQANFDYYGNRIPSRDELKKGSKGTYQNAVKFWSEENVFYEY
jgi:hypothetical protein